MLLLAHWMRWLIIILIVLAVGSVVFLYFSLPDKSAIENAGGETGSGTEAGVGDTGFGNADADSSSIGDSGIETNQSAGGGSGGGSDGSSGGTDTNPGGSSGENTPLTCVLIRPGNIPDVGCSVNYINANGVSLKIKNDFGKDLKITADLESCHQEITEIVENKNSRDFVFSCNNSGIFYHNLAVKYFVDNGTISVGGFVSGSVS